jgi:hypothetical protein
MSKNLKTFNDKNMEMTDNIKDDVVSIHAKTNSPMQISHHNEVNNDVSTKFEIKHCYLATV